ncbi:PPP4R2-domain-containing protein [Paraphysoderma sedebokerense]|nr:PPP4R2-domain-containing protein [Paraphysoderma sedebokerense]
MMGTHDLSALEAAPESSRQWRSEFTEILAHTAESSHVLHSWSLTKELIKFKILENVKSEYARLQSLGLAENINSSELDEQLLSIGQCFESHTEPPFTVQRLCELVLEPNRCHKSIPKYLRAVEKVLRVTSPQTKLSSPQIQSNASASFINPTFSMEASQQQYLQPSQSLPPSSLAANITDTTATSLQTLPSGTVTPDASLNGIGAAGGGIVTTAPWVTAAPAEGGKVIGNSDGKEAQSTSEVDVMEM